MNYKAGDTPRVHTLKWFEKHINNGEISFPGSILIVNEIMTELCGKKVTITYVIDNDYYEIKEDEYKWQDWMFESPEEEHKTYAEILEYILQETSIDISHDIVFISGSITNDKNYKQKFAALEQKLVSKGCIVLNPAVIPEGMEHDAYMPICYAMIDQSETVVFMHDWRISDGAKMEMIRAIKKNKRIVFEEEI